LLAVQIDIPARSFCPIQNRLSANANSQNWKAACVHAAMCYTSSGKRFLAQPVFLSDTPSAFHSGAVEMQRFIRRPGLDNPLSKTIYLSANVRGAWRTNRLRSRW
jgi:hypothetical protein